jgi:hypothetical protein
MPGRDLASALYTFVDAELTEELRPEGVERRGATLARPLDLHFSVEAHMAVGSEDEHTVGEHNRLLDIVGDEEHCRTMTLAEHGQQTIHLEARQGIRGAEGLSTHHHGSVAPDWGVGIALGIGGLLGGYTGARLQPRMPESTIRRLLGLLVLAIGIRYTWLAAG